MCVSLGVYVHEFAGAPGGQENVLELELELWWLWVGQHGCWEPKSGPRRAARAFTSDPSLQPHQDLLLTHCLWSTAVSGVFSIVT